MTVRELIRVTSEYLEGKGVTSSKLNAERLLADVLGLARIELFFQHDRPVLGDELDRFRVWCVAARGASRCSRSWARPNSIHGCSRSAPGCSSPGRRPNGWSKRPWPCWPRRTAGCWRRWPWKSAAGPASSELPWPWKYLA